mgnify:CR=1 FL=1
MPNWGLIEFEQHKEKLVNYHDWLYTTGIKTGLISKKPKQFIWDEFIVHSLYFHHLIKNIISKSVKNEIGEDYKTRKLEAIKVKGKRKPVEIFKVLT